jgi:hypothetical protein
MMKQLFILMTVAGFFTGCAFKSVMEGEADNILKTALYSNEGKNYLVMLESVFQATSKGTDGGITQITGFNVLRISVYNIKDGNLVNRKKTGKEIKNPVVFLGCTKGNLWFYSFVDGIHSLDPESLKASRIPWEYHSFDARRDQPFETSISFQQPYFSITGDLRKQIKVGNKEINPGLTFLDGEFIADRNPARNLEALDRKLSSYMLKMEALYPRIMELNGLNGGQGPQRGDHLRDTLRILENYRYRSETEIKALENYRNDIMDDGNSFSYMQLLSPDTTSFFVFHRSGTQKDAKAVISRIEMKNFKEIKELWSTEIPGLFFDPSAAEETNAFKEVFSKGNPEFRFSFFDRTDNRLIIVWMLHVCCLDMNTGRLLWKFRV